jgi:protein-disulfide isomerase
MRSRVVPALLAFSAAVALIGAGAIAARLVSSGAAGSSAAGGATPAALDVPGVQAVVAQYIQGHPELILAALDEERARQALEEQARTSSAIHQHLAELFANRSSPVLGDPRGDVNVAEFFDFRCPYCKRTAPLLEQLIARDRRVRLVFKNLPILGPDSTYAAHLGLAAARLGRFGDFYKAIFARVPAHGDREAIDRAVRSIGLDPSALAEQSHTPEIDRAVQRDLDLAAGLGISGTPALVIGDQVLSGAPSPEVLDAAVRAARNK